MKFSCMLIDLSLVINKPLKLCNKNYQTVTSGVYGRNKLRISRKLRMREGRTCVEEIKLGNF